ncbi:methyltransferase domain-containing protein [Nocardioides sp. CPCC 206347]|uniref:methyltransferase domain-containing protein n=2 Tax=Nocardioides TaxID=1839 RepID=UPI003B42B74A
MTGRGPVEVFDDKLADWRAWADAPWGRIRFAVVEETLRRQVAELGGGPLRVLDVGGGDGRDAVPLARAGHHVTILDPAPLWLAEARCRAEAAGVADRITTVTGSLDDLDEEDGADGVDGLASDFDLVLCHFVLHYRSPGPADPGRLAARVRPGGRVSVMAPNPEGRVVMALTRQGPAAALAELEADTMSSHTFDQTARKIAAHEMVGDLATAGLTLVHRYGARIANDFLADDRPKQDAEYFAELLRLEVALCDREPFLRMGGMWQLVVEKP